MSNLTPTHSAVGQLPGLLSTKLNRPRLPHGYVPRPRLVEMLGVGLRDLTLLCAPAGFGKTALLADLCQRHDRSVAWLSLDAADSDPVRFWRHAAAALDRVRPGVADRVAPLIGSRSESASVDGLVTTVINELAAQDTEVVLVLDDYHLIDAEPVHSGLSYLLEHLPPGLRVVLASRADPPFPLARLRAAGRLAEIRAAELRFTPDEAAALLAEAVGSVLSADAVATLTARTEGWAAGLQLAGLSLQGRSGVPELIEAFSGSHRYVLDYLSEEVLERQPKQVQAFLIETSVLERLSGPLCDAVTGRTDSQKMLEEIEQANLFLVPLDEEREWWRYHQLFADLLRVRLQKQDRDRVAELHRRSAGWHECHGQVEDAVRHAIAAGEDVWAARLVERSFDALYLGSQGATVKRWLDSLPTELCESRPRLLLAQVWLALFSGRIENVSRWLDAAERAPTDAIDKTFEPSVGAQASWLANVPAAIAVARADIAHWRGDGEQTIAFSTQALTDIGDDEWLLHTDAYAHLAAGRWLCGQLREAEYDAAFTFTRFRACGAYEMAAVWAGYYFGAIRRAQGRLDAAQKIYEQALDLASSRDGVRLPAAGVEYAGMAEIAYQRDDLDTAHRKLTEAIPLCRQFVSTQALATSLATLAWISHARGDDENARAAMTQAGEATGGEVADLINPVPASRARLLLAQGDVAAASQWVDERGLNPDDEKPTYAHEPAYLVLARVLLATGRAGDALALLDRMHTAAAAQDRIGSVIEIQALRALAIAAEGDESAAVSTLIEALTLAQPQGYVRVFIDEGPRMWALLRSVVAAERTTSDAVSLEYLGRLLRASERSSGGSESHTVVSGLVVQLTERELEVLALLAAGKRNQEIAAELFLALSTVKKHVTHILDKLGATNRTEATARARELGLL